MQCVIVFTVILAAASAQLDPYSQARYTPGVVNRAADQAARTISLTNEVYPDGSYQHSFNTDNGIAAEAQGTPKVVPGSPEVAVVSQGAFSWISPEGVPINIRYIADENGYQPAGDALPTPPPIPDVILRSIEYNLRNAQPQRQ